MIFGKRNAPKTPSTDRLAELAPIPTCAVPKFGPWYSGQNTDEGQPLAASPWKQWLDSYQRHSALSYEDLHMDKDELHLVTRVLPLCPPNVRSETETDLAPPGAFGAQTS